MVVQKVLPVLATQLVDGDNTLNTNNNKTIYLELYPLYPNGRRAAQRKGRAGAHGAKSRALDGPLAALAGENGKSCAPRAPPPLCPVCPQFATRAHRKRPVVPLKVSGCARCLMVLYFRYQHEQRTTQWANY